MKPRRHRSTYIPAPYTARGRVAAAVIAVTRANERIRQGAQIAARRLNTKD